MKQKFLALLLVLLMIPVAVVLASETDWADSLMEETYAVIGGDQSITIRSHTAHNGRGGYSHAVYAYELTGTESKAELDAIAVELLESGAAPVWGGKKYGSHIGIPYEEDREYTMNASEYEPGGYVYVCYAYICEHDNHNHNPVPCYDRISTMGVRVTAEARGLELEYVLTDRDGGELAVLADGDGTELNLNGGAVYLKLESSVEYPTERVVDIRTDFSKNQAVDSFALTDGILEPVCCGEGSITVSIQPYLSEEIRTETIYIEIPCASMAEAVVLTEPTCTQDGLSAYLCQGYGINCETIFEEVPLRATGHTLRDVEAYIEEPTATLPGIGVGVCAVCGEADAEQELPPIFSDVIADSFYGPALDYCYAAGWVNGVSADCFAPGNACMRAQVVTFLWRAAGRPEPVGGDNPFLDVKESDFYYQPVLWAVEEGITTGTDATHFSPFAVCNRAQVVTFLWRAFGQPESSTEKQPFTDVEMGSWYEAPVLWAVEEGITSGMSATTFGPVLECNRAQIVTFLYRAYAGIS